ncbi:MAG: NmrA family NAD(P)-binding protein, partial [Gammaproteobacteria bacterium]|nr:NmrA family NAD(P)-binding protein [Gammaproteobacteria bacterium]
MTKPTIVVVNGSADEGFWTAYYLLKTKCFNVRATVRRLTGDKAERLRELKAGGGRCEVVQAATEDEPALRAAFRGAIGIYGTTIYNIHARRYRADNPEEMAQGRSLLAAARATPTLRHFVFQTMMRFCTPSAEIGLEAPIHFRTKWQLEEELKAADLPWTLVRQPAYMRQLRFGVSRGRKIVYPYANDYPLAFVAEEDIGKVVARIFMERESFLQQAVKVVSDIVTPAELAARAHACLPFISPRYRKT